jgi:hypothetical protein
MNIVINYRLYITNTDLIPFVGSIHELTLRKEGLRDILLYRQQLTTNN